MVNDQLKPPPADTIQIGGHHYKKMGIQHWSYVLANKIPYMEAQIIKYVSRWRDKNGIEDLKKAQHFLAKLIEYEEEQKQLADGSEPTGAYVDQGKDHKHG